MVERVYVVARFVVSWGDDGDVMEFFEVLLRRPRRASSNMTREREVTEVFLFVREDHCNSGVDPLCCHGGPTPTSGKSDPPKNKTRPNFNHD